jgi:hypothetical protein
LSSGFSYEEKIYREVKEAGKRPKEQKPDCAVKILVFY